MNSVFLNLLRPIGIDFPQYFEAARMVFSGQNPYVHLLTSPGPFNYPPPVFLFLFWLNFLPFNLAGAVWNVLSLVSFLIAIWLSMKLVIKKNWLLFLLLTVLFTLPFFPEKFNLGNGQINNFILLMVVGSFYFYLRRKNYPGALLLALATSIKLVPGIFLLYFVVKKDWTFVARFIVILTGLFLVPLIFLPWDIEKIYYFRVFFNAFSSGGKAVYYNQSLMAFLSRSFVTESAARVGMYLGSLILVLLTVWRGRKISFPRLLAALFSLMLMVNPLSWQHHFVFAVPALIILLTQSTLSRKNLASWATLVVSYLLLSWNFRKPGGVPGEFSWLLSNQFLGVLLLWLIALFEEKMDLVLITVWAGGISLAYVFILLCRARICF